jgi:hypothetical protein
MESLAILANIAEIVFSSGSSASSNASSRQLSYSGFMATPNSPRRSIA